MKHLTQGVLVGIGIGILISVAFRAEATTVYYQSEPEEVVVEWTPERIEQEIRKTFHEEPDLAVAIAKAESGLDPTAANWKDSHKGCKGSFGIFQIACIHDNPDELYNPAYNIKRAREIYDESGWKPWGAFTDRRYLSYMK